MLNVVYGIFSQNVRTLDEQNKFLLTFTGVHFKKP